MRDGYPVLGRHIHLLAELAGEPCGQVEGWFERHGVDPTTLFTCEVRSLIVAGRARQLGAGRRLLDALAASARTLAWGGAAARAGVAAGAGAGADPGPPRAARCVLAAEVLEANPARSFYTRVGYAPGSHSARIESAAGARPAGGAFCARVALPRDALAVACLEGVLAERRRSAGDLRFDRPRAVDATMVGAIAAHLGGASRTAHAAGAAGAAGGADGAGAGAAQGGPFGDPLAIVALDRAGLVRASAAFTTHALEPPFITMRRALVGRFALDPACPAGPLVAPMVALACRMALSQGAPLVELTDLSAPGTPLHDAALAAGAQAWSSVMLKID